jgi:hypothetical protein
MNLGMDTSFSAARDVRARRFHEEIILLDLAAGEYFSVDEVGARVWDGLAAGLTLAAVVAALAPDYDTDVSRLETDVLAFTGELLRRGLIVEAMK